MNTLPVTPKKLMRPCPRCPHQLSDLWSHESPPESPSNSAQPISEIPEAETSKHDGDNEDISSSTLIEDQVDEDHVSSIPPDYPDTASEHSRSPEYSGDERPEDDLSEYHELGSDDEFHSSDEHNDDDYKTSKECCSDEEYLLVEYESEDEHRGEAEQKPCSFCNLSLGSSQAKPKCPFCDPIPPDVKTDLAAASKEKSRPETYTCYGCGQFHGSPAQSENTKTYGVEEVGPRGMLNVGVMEETLADGRTILWKHCGRCIETTALEWPSEYDNPRLYELYAEKYGPFSERNDKGPSAGQFEKWKEFFNKVLPSPQLEVALEEAPVASGLEAVVEGAEES
jgi:hypothetical protein